jgi:hypothetical protein
VDLPPVRNAGRRGVVVVVVVLGTGVAIKPSSGDDVVRMAVAPRRVVGADMGGDGRFCITASDDMDRL